MKMSKTKLFVLNIFHRRSSTMHHKDQLKPQIRLQRRQSTPKCHTIKKRQGTFSVCSGTLVAFYVRPAQLIIFYYLRHIIKTYHHQKPANQLLITTNDQTFDKIQHKLVGGNFGIKECESSVIGNLKKKILWRQTQF